MLPEASYIHPPKTMLQVFKSLPEGTLVQLIENKLIMSPSPLDRHQAILVELSSQLNLFVKNKNLGVVRVAPYDVYLDKTNVFQPDICFISKAKMKYIKENGLHGSPDLVIEILSPGTRRHDLYTKKNVYEKCRVKEYWIIDPANNSSIGYELIQNKYQEIFKGKSKIASKLLKWSADF